MTEELKPCPFCGGAAKMNGNGIGDFYVQCTGCLARSDDRHCEERSHAVERWNRRAPATPQTDQGWRPIDSAPKDGTYIQVCRKDESFGWITGVATWVSDFGISGWIAKGTGFFGELGLADPHLWQPLALPPAPQGEN